MVIVKIEERRTPVSALLSMALLAIAILTLGFGSPVMAASAADGADVFLANCAACHAGGQNVVEPTKTLQKDVLVANGKFSAEAIIAQAINGAGAMPAFGGTISSDQIANVAAYILEKAESGW